MPNPSLYAEGGRRTRLRVKLVHQDIEKYKATLERNRTKYKIVEQTEQPDGSVMLKIIKQMNMSPVGDYLD